MRFETYLDKRGEFRWRLKSANGKIIAVSSEGYKNNKDMRKALKLVRTGAPTAKVKAVK